MPRGEATNLYMWMLLLITFSPNSPQSLTPLHTLPPLCPVPPVFADFIAGSYGCLLLLVSAYPLISNISGAGRGLLTKKNSYPLIMDNGGSPYPLVIINYGPKPPTPPIGGPELRLAILEGRTKREAREEGPVVR